MKVYHMSDTLGVGMVLSNNYKKYWELAEPFLQALARGEDCFYGAYFAAKFMRESLDKFGLADMQTDYVKWAAEAVFEYVRQREFPGRCCRLKCNYFFDDIASCRALFEMDWGKAPEEERAKIKLFEIELAAESADRFDMRWFDKAYDDLWETDNITHSVVFARQYFSQDSTEQPIWEIASDQNAVALRDLSGYLYK